MTKARIEALERLLASRPDDARLRFGLALEYEKAGRAQDAVRALESYLAHAEDEGNAWGRLGALLRGLGRDEEARAAYRRGIEQAARHGHPSMAAELAASLNELE
jgi:E3 SUMO-protein ligase RanBP2